MPFFLNYGPCAFAIGGFKFKKKLSSFRLTLKEEKDMKLTFHEKKKRN